MDMQLKLNMMWSLINTTFPSGVTETLPDLSLGKNVLDGHGDYSQREIFGQMKSY